ncbi:MAG: hypothetical protein M3277_11615 [Actinomycetota bacterium]|nr:hypothetical protein [Actinomycetota bacterium]
MTSRSPGTRPTFVYAEPNNKKKIKQTIWGDYSGLKGEQDGDWRKVRARGRDGWMRKDDIQSERSWKSTSWTSARATDVSLLAPDRRRVVRLPRRGSRKAPDRSVSTASANAMGAKILGTVTTLGALKTVCERDWPAATVLSWSSKPATKAGLL